MVRRRKEPTQDRGIRASRRPPEEEQEMTPEETHTAFYEAAQRRQTKQWEFAGPILHILLTAPGEELTAKECIDEIELWMEGRLSAHDWEISKNREPRWKGAVRFEVQALKKKGYISDKAPRKVWRLG